MLLGAIPTSDWELPLGLFGSLCFLHIRNPQKPRHTRAYVALASLGLQRRRPVRICLSGAPPNHIPVRRKCCTETHSVASPTLWRPLLRSPKTLSLSMGLPCGHSDRLRPRDLPSLGGPQLQGGATEGEETSRQAGTQAGGLHTSSDALFTAPCTPATVHG